MKEKNGYRIVIKRAWFPTRIYLGLETRWLFWGEKYESHQVLIENPDKWVEIKRELL